MARLGHEGGEHRARAAWAGRLHRRVSRAGSEAMGATCEGGGWGGAQAARATARASEQGRERGGGADVRAGEG